MSRPGNSAERSSSGDGTWGLGVALGTSGKLIQMVRLPDMGQGRVVVVKKLEVGATMKIK